MVCYVVHITHVLSKVKEEKKKEEMITIQLHIACKSSHVDMSAFKTRFMYTVQAKRY